jgi:galactokinase
LAGITRETLTADFSRRFPGSAVPKLWRAPGRINLIGEHTDYNLGFVMPMAIAFSTYIAAAPSLDGKLRAYSANMDDTREWTPGNLQRAGDWGDYVAGVANSLDSFAPMNLYIHSEVPTGAGLSSSAALELSTALALLDGREMAPLDLVKLCRRAENEFVGMPCGIMDQFISGLAREHAALRIDCRSLEYEVVTLPEDVLIVAVNSMVKHELGSSAYRTRVAECAAAAAMLGVASLRDATRDGGDKRARHIVSENARVEAFRAACSRGDLHTMGELFVASHRSLQHDYEVSCEELDFLVDTAIAIDGVYGSRMTGGGFGGCTVNMVAPEKAAAFEQSITAAYEARYGITPRIYRSVPAAGAGAF